MTTSNNGSYLLLDAAATNGEHVATDSSWRGRGGRMSDIIDLRYYTLADSRQLVRISRLSLSPITSRRIVDRHGTELRSVSLEKKINKFIYIYTLYIGSKNRPKKSLNFPLRFSARQCP